MGRPKKQDVNVVSIIENLIKQEESEDKRNFFKLMTQSMNYIENEITYEEFIKYLDKNIIVNPYVTLEYKKEVIDMFFILYDEQSEFTDLTYIYEIFSVMVLLFFYTNITVDESDISEENYNIVMQSGLFDYIYNKCKNDYDRFSKIIFNALQFKTHSIIKMLYDNISENNLESVVNNTQSMLKDIDLEKMQLLQQITSFNDPSLKSVQNFLYDASKNIDVSQLHDIKKEE